MYVKNKKCRLVFCILLWVWGEIEALILKGRVDHGTYFPHNDSFSSSSSSPATSNGKGSRLRRSESWNGGKKRRKVEPGKSDSMTGQQLQAALLKKYEELEGRCWGLGESFNGLEARFDEVYDGFERYHHDFVEPLIDEYEQHSQKWSERVDVMEQQVAAYYTDMSDQIADEVERQVEDDHAEMSDKITAVEDRMAVFEARMAAFEAKQVGMTDQVIAAVEKRMKAAFEARQVEMTGQIIAAVEARTAKVAGAAVIEALNTYLVH